MVWDSFKARDGTKDKNKPNPKFPITFIPTSFSKMTIS